MLLVAGSVNTLSHVEHLVVHLLRLVASEKALLLFRGDIRDERLLRFEVVGNSIQLILIASLLEHRFSFDVSQTIHHTHSMDDRTVHVHCNQIGSQCDVLVVHLTVTIQMGILRVHVEHQRVFRFESHRVFQRTFLRLRDGVLHGCNGIVPLDGFAITLLSIGFSRNNTVVADAVLTVERPFHGVQFCQSLLVFSECVFLQRISLS